MWGLTENINVILTKNLPGLVTSVSDGRVRYSFLDKPILWVLLHSKALTLTKRQTMLASNNESPCELGSSGRDYQQLLTVFLKLSIQRSSCLFLRLDSTQPELRVKTTIGQASWSYDVIDA